MDTSVKEFVIMEIVHLVGLLKKCLAGARGLCRVLSVKILANRFCVGKFVGVRNRVKNINVMRFVAKD